MTPEKSDRYELLLQAIEVFTQRYDKDVLLQFAFDFANQLLKLEKSALFKRKEDQFVLINTEGYDFRDYTIPSTEKLEGLPLFYGRPLSNGLLGEYFTAGQIRDFAAVHAIPLINDTVLDGLILTDTAISQEEEITSAILMSLVNASLENNQRLLDFQTVHAELDRKVFSLFVLNQSIKALLSELDISKLYDMATDVFSEISGSRVTGFGTYDPLSHKIQLKGYRNVHSFKRLYAELSLRDTGSCPGLTVINLKQEKEWVASFFEDASALEELEAEYIILIQKERLLGLVTLSESRLGVPYDSGTFELIETLASSTYIALNNAQTFEKQEKQKREAESKLGILQMYNRLIRTINSCKTKEELMKLSLSTIELGFGVKKAFFAFQTGEAYQISASTDADLAGETFTMNEDMQEKIGEDIYYDYLSGKLSACFREEWFCRKLGESSGLIIAPICITNDFSEDPVRPYGYLIVTETASSLQEEEILLIDTLTRNITPLIYHMDQRDHVIFSETAGDSTWNT
ncbi:hypothetical protein GKZ89_16030 [Bacillus mangrovi]|uniref:GAF domain-containing protein n=1 Tax=Metabacillus mangrovi TaxID=1491830 RepID=A0A7X2V5K8_9BACI|nr:hypothetical protein [Metabacillus mangrovi]MTH54912.1 hypothetical protein [Metabacillus mangrovi]